MTLQIFELLAFVASHHNHITTTTVCPTNDRELSEREEKNYVNPNVWTLRLYVKLNLNM